jgi:glycosyltransferase involved in cell wall biosynthesis
VAVSQAVARTVEVLEGLSAEKIRVIHNGFDWDWVRPRIDGVAEWRQRFEGRRIIVSIGRMDPVKDVPTLLRAVAIVSKSHPDVVLVIAGEGPTEYTAELRQLVRALGIDDRTFMPGFVEDVFDLLAAADVYAQASLDEACSQTISQALGLGVPLAVTTTGGTPELVGPDNPPLAPRDPEALARRIGELLDDPEAARAAAAARSVTARRDLGADNMVAQYLEVYASVVGCRPHPGRAGVS